jgi:hypothetical protein
MTMLTLAYDTDIDHIWARAMVDDAFAGPFTRRLRRWLCVPARGRSRPGAGGHRRRSRPGAGRPPHRQTQLPELGAPRSDSCEGDEGDIIVRNPDTEVVAAAMKTITETIQISYG